MLTETPKLGILTQSAGHRYTKPAPAVTKAVKASTAMEERRENVSEVFEKVQGIIVEQLGVDESEVTRDASFREDLEADSLDLVELIMAFEEEFGGEISDEEAQEIETVGQAVDYIEQHMMEES